MSTGKSKLRQAIEDNRLQKRLCCDPKGERAKMERIVEVCEQLTGFSRSKLFSKSRSRDLTLVRQIAMTLAYQETALSTTEVGNFFGGRDHGTVTHAIRVVSNVMEVESSVANLFRTIQKAYRASVVGEVMQVLVEASDLDALQVAIDQIHEPIVAVTPDAGEMVTRVEDARTSKWKEAKIILKRMMPVL